MRRLVILTEGNFGPHHGKTAMGVIRYGTDPIAAVLDSSIAGRNVREWLPEKDIPAVATLAEALALPEPPNTLLIGIAPTGGKLPESWRRTILAAIDAGLDVHSGLHTFLGDDPEFAAAAAARGTEIVDYRRPPERKETAVGRPHSPGNGPASRTRSAPARIGSGTSLTCRASAPPASFALDWRTASGMLASAGTFGTRTPRAAPAPAGPAASGKRPAGLGNSRVTGPGVSASTAARVCGGRSASVASARSRSNHITAAGLSAGRPFSS